MERGSGCHGVLAVLGEPPGRDGGGVDQRWGGIKAGDGRRLAGEMGAALICDGEGEKRVMGGGSPERLGKEEAERDLACAAVQLRSVPLHRPNQFFSGRIGTRDWRGELAEYRAKPRGRAPNWRLGRASVVAGDRILGFNPTHEYHGLPNSDIWLPECQSLILALNANIQTERKPFSL